MSVYEQQKWEEAIWHKYYVAKMWASFALKGAMEEIVYM